MRINACFVLWKVIDFIVLIGLILLCSTFEWDQPKYDIYVSCDDERYRNPLIPTSDHLVPTLWLYMGVLLILPGLFFGLETILVFGLPADGISEDRLKKLVEFFDTIALYYFGALFVLIVNKISAFVGGSPAPNFLALCLPGCSNSSAAYIDRNTHRSYVTQMSCPQQGFSQETLASFPSVHAMLTFYGAGFITLSHFHKESKSQTRLLQPAIVVLACTMAIVTSLSRISEYSNHVVDVVAGAGIGVTVAIVQVWRSRDFKFFLLSADSSSAGSDFRK